jgi:hypothetical protein
VSRGPGRSDSTTQLPYVDPQGVACAQGGAAPLAFGLVGLLRVLAVPRLAWLACSDSTTLWPPISGSCAVSQRSRPVVPRVAGRFASRARLVVPRFAQYRQPARHFAAPRNARSAVHFAPSGNDGPPVSSQSGGRFACGTKGLRSGVTVKTRWRPSLLFSGITVREGGPRNPGLESPSRLGDCPSPRNP